MLMIREHVIRICDDHSKYAAAVDLNIKRKMLSPSWDKAVSYVCYKHRSVFLIKSPAIFHPILFLYCVELNQNIYFQYNCHQAALFNPYEITERR